MSVIVVGVVKIVALKPVPMIVVVMVIVPVIVPFQIAKGLSLADIFYLQAVLPQLL